MSNNPMQSSITHLVNIFSMTAVGFLLTAWLIPNHYAPWAAFYNDFSAALGLMILASLTYLRYPQKGDMVITWPAIFLMLLAAIPLIQLTAGQIQFSGDAWISFFYLAGLALAYLTGYRTSHESHTDFTSKIAWAFLLGALISLFLALYQWLELDGLGIWLADLPPTQRPYANLGQPNNLATLFALGLIASLYLYEKSHLGGQSTCLLAFLLMVGIAITQSRTPLVIMVVLAGWILASRRRLALKLTFTQLFTAILTLAFLSLHWQEISNALYLGSPTTTRMLETSSANARFQFWGQLFDAAWRKPIAGYGWNQTTMAQIAVVKDYPQSIMTEYSHNFILDLFVWNGALIGGLVTLGLAWWLLSRLRKCPDLEAWFGLAVILAVGTHGLLEYPLAYAYFLLPVGICAGLVDRSYSVAKIRSHPFIFAFITIAGWIVLAFVFTEYRNIENDHRLMRYQSARIGIHQGMSNPPRTVLLNQLSEFIQYARTEADENMNPEELGWMRSVAHRYPSPPALFRYALALGLNHRYEEAAHELLLLKHLYPSNQITEARGSWHLIAAHYPQLQQVRLP